MCKSCHLKYKKNKEKESLYRAPYSGSNQKQKIKILGGTLKFRRRDKGCLVTYTRGRWQQ